MGVVVDRRSFPVAVLGMVKRKEQIPRRQRRGFNEGDRVRARFLDWTGVVKRKGVEVSEVKRDDNDATRYIINEHLERIR